MKRILKAHNVVRHHIDNSPQEGGTHPRDTSRVAYRKRDTS